MRLPNEFNITIGRDMGDWAAVLEHFDTFDRGPYTNKDRIFDYVRFGEDKTILVAMPNPNNPGMILKVGTRIIDKHIEFKNFTVEEFLSLKNTPRTIPARSTDELFPTL